MGADTLGLESPSQLIDEFQFGVTKQAQYGRIDRFNPPSGINGDNSLDGIINDGLIASAKERGLFERLSGEDRHAGEQI